MLGLPYISAYLQMSISHMKARDILNFEKLGIRKYRRTTKKGQRV